MSPRSLAVDTSPMVNRPRVKEGAIQAAILAQLVAMGIACWRQNTGAAKDKRGRLVRFGVVGQGDLAGILPGGRYFEIECKAERGRITPAQRARAEQLAAAGALYIVAREVASTVLAIRRAAGI